MAKTSAPRDFCQLAPLLETPPVHKLDAVPMLKSLDHFSFLGDDSSRGWAFPLIAPGLARSCFEIAPLIFSGSGPATPPLAQRPFR